MKMFYNHIIKEFNLPHTILLFCLLSFLGVISCAPNEKTVQRAALEEIIKPEQAVKKPFSKEGMILIPEGILNMGADNEQARNDEYPKHKIKINSFWMDETEVTNAQFAKFVAETNYITVAERAVDWEEMVKMLPPGTPKPPDSLLQPGTLVFKRTNSPVNLNDYSQWWEWTIGADWRHPKGPRSNIKGLEDHPVVQVAWEDAIAYAEWAGKRLPTEAEWEWASRGGLEDEIYPWGNEFVEEGKPKANFWQGIFPFQNTLNDGYDLTAPVKSYPPNNYGLYDMAGNVWEWCGDWYDSAYYESFGENTAQKIDGPNRSFDPNEPYTPKKVVRGGSFLCSESYCSGYRNSSRMSSSPDTGLSHTGFRCVAAF